MANIKTLFHVLLQFSLTLFLPSVPRYFMQVQTSSYERDLATCN